MAGKASGSPNEPKRFLGRMREALGWATGDRRTEAAGQLQQLPDDPADPSPATAALDKAELHVRDDHGDLAPSAQPADHDPTSPPVSG